MRGRGGPITAAVDGPGGPILAGDHRRRDKGSCDFQSEMPSIRKYAEVTVTC